MNIKFLKICLLQEQSTPEKSRFLNYKLQLNKQRIKDTCEQFSQDRKHNIKSTCRIKKRVYIIMLQTHSKNFNVYL